LDSGQISVCCALTDSVTWEKGKVVDTADLHKRLRAINVTIDSINAAVKADTSKGKVVALALKVKLENAQKSKVALPKVDTINTAKCGLDKGRAKKYDIEDTIPFNTILLILVAAAGFLGNMVHIATSFTAWVGTGNFKRSWLLWYFVKPFTASALALIVYFTFRAGFLSSSDAGSNINIYGIMSIAALTGLFTEVVTSKLRDVLDVIFKPNGGKATPALAVVPVIFGATPVTLKALAANTITITGTDLDKAPLTITMGGTVIAATGKPTPTSTTFNFTAGAVGTSVVLSITGTGVKTYSQTFTVA
jgi:hypothetical protein